jgi:hypothetical protein
MMPNEFWLIGCQEDELFRGVILGILNIINQGGRCASDFGTYPRPNLPIDQFVALIVTQPIVDAV